MWMCYFFINIGIVFDLGVFFLYELIKIIVNLEILVNGNNIVIMECVF